MPTIVKAESLSRALPDGRILLDRVSLEIASGDRVAIQGPAGSGKTLLLRALALLDPTSTGTVFWLGSLVPDAQVPSYRSHVAYLSQTPALADGTVETNLRLPFSLGIYNTRSYDQPRVLALLERLGRDNSFLTQPVSALSGGERQIVALVRLLQLEPTVLLLDEPTAALDPESTLSAQKLIEGWADADSERAYVWVSHDDRQAQTVSKRRIRMEGGRVQ